MKWYEFTDGDWKLVHFAGGYCLLVHPDVSFMDVCAVYRAKLGICPSVLSAYPVPVEFADTYRGEYEAKGLLIEGAQESEL